MWRVDAGADRCGQNGCRFRCGLKLRPRLPDFCSPHCYPSVNQLLPLETPLLPVCSPSVTYLFYLCYPSADVIALYRMSSDSAIK